MRLYSADYIIPVSAFPIEKGSVLVNKGVIIKAGETSELKKKFTISNEVVFENCTLLPGLVNPHTHLELSSFKPPENPYKSMAEWILSIIPAKLSLSDEQKAANIKNGLNMLLRNGTTTVGDNLSWWNLTNAYADADLRGVIFLEIIGLEENQTLEKIGKLREKIMEKPPGCFSFGLAPHSVYSVSEMLLKEILVLDKKFSFPSSIHLQESEDEEELTKKASGGFAGVLYPLLGLKNDASERFQGLTSVSYLRKIGFFSLPLLTIHNCNVEKEEIPFLFKQNVKPVFCLRSNETLGNKLPDIHVWLKIFSDRKVGIGTDSLASVSSLSMWDEMRYIKKTFPDIPETSILTMATMGGAYSLGVSDSKGSLEKCKDADIIAVNTAGFDGTSSELPAFIVDNTTEDRLECTVIGGEICYRKKV